MIIINIDETRVHEVAQYANRLNQMNKHKCKACANNYENTVYSFRKMIKHPDDEVLICIEQNKILGVLALLVEPKEKYLEAVGGVYAEKNYQEIAMEFYRYMKEKYTGFRFDAVYHYENKEAICFMESIGAACSGVDLEMKLKKDNFKSLKNNKQVFQLSENYYEEFCKFHDEAYPNVYWTGERLLSTLDKFNILIAVDKGKIVGSLVSSTYEQNKKEIYFHKIDKCCLREEYAKSLLENCIEEAFLEGIKEIMIVVKMDDIPAINLYELFGFHKADATITYSIESL